MRARGLKPGEQPEEIQRMIVAPHAGAWIETLGLTIESRVFPVAPHAGAWIETRFSTLLLVAQWSRPMRARGLKPGRRWKGPLDGVSRPMRARGLKHRRNILIFGGRGSRPMRARGLKQSKYRNTHMMEKSRPMRARGLKRTSRKLQPFPATSRPMRARGLKPYDLLLTCETEDVAPHAGAWIETSG